MAVLLCCSRSLGNKVTLSPDESQISSYTTSKSPLPLSQASPLPWRTESRHATGGPGVRPTNPSKNRGTATAAPEQHFPPPQSPRGHVSIAHSGRESLSLTARGERPPHLSYKHGACWALQVLCSAALEGLKARELHKITFSCSRSQTSQVYKHQQSLPTSLRPRSQTCPCHQRCVNKTDLCLPQCPWLSDDGHWNHRVPLFVHEYLAFIIAYPEYLSWIWGTFAMTKLVNHLPIIFAIANDIPKDSTAWLMPPHLSSGPVKGFWHDWGTARHDWFGNPTWDFLVFGFSQ